MKQAIIVHRWDGSPSGDWYPWLSKELEEIGYAVIVPEMPNPSCPKIDEWVEALEKIIEDVKHDDEEIVLIGHSIGCQTIMRYLAKEESIRIDQAVFVAGWFNLENLEDESVKEIARPWIETGIDFKAIREKIGKLSVFLSSNEPYGYVKENARMFREQLGAEIILLEERGHFTEDDGCLTLPELVLSINMG